MLTCAQYCRTKHIALPHAGNNRVGELREVQRLRELPRLIILDLSGNPATGGTGADYRLYVIYNVRKLKVREARVDVWLASLLQHTNMCGVQGLGAVQHTQTVERDPWGAHGGMILGM